ncbi:hypothetical protein LINGRAPRIM_LOCUS332, partial [Linum grandiflorum]
MEEEIVKADSPQATEQESKPRSRKRNGSARKEDASKK